MVVFTNASTGDMPYGKSPGIGAEPHGELFNEVDVRDEGGNSSPETDYQRLLRGEPLSEDKPTANDKSAAESPSAKVPKPRPRIHGSATGEMLKPGESREATIVLNKLFDLSKSGRYAVSVRRRLSDLATDPRSEVIATSNTLTITITK